MGIIIAGGPAYDKSPRVLSRARKLSASRSEDRVTRQKKKADGEMGIILAGQKLARQNLPDPADRHVWTYGKPSHGKREMPKPANPSRDPGGGAGKGRLFGVQPGKALVRRDFERPGLPPAQASGF